MNLDWIKSSPGMQLFCLFISMFFGMILGSFVIIFLPASSLAIKHILSSLFIFLFPVLFCTLSFNLYSIKTFFASSLKISAALLAILLLLVSFPLMEFLSKISSTISFESFAPQVQRFFDTSQEASVKSIKMLFANGNISTLLLNLIVIAVTPAIVEELFFRGCLQTTVMKFFKSPHLAIWIVAIIFSLFHMQIDGCITRVVLGALLGYLYYYGGNIIYPIIFHFFNNAIVAITIFKIGVDKANDFQLFQSWDILFVILLSLCSTLFIVLVLSLFRKRTSGKTFLEYH